MSVFKVLIEQVTYYPDGPTKAKTAKKGELIMLQDELDYIVGSQINPAHVQKVDPTVIAKAAEEAEKVQADVIAKAEKAK